VTEVEEELRKTREELERKKKEEEVSKSNCIHSIRSTNPINLA